MLIDEDVYLEHWGVKGMHWGIRKQRDSAPSIFRLTTSPVQIEPSISSATRKSVEEVAPLIGKRYGFQISAVQNLKTHNPAEYAHGTVAFVQHTPGKSGGIVYVKPEDSTKELKAAEKRGWFAKDTGNMRAMLTHESAHAMFHAEESTKAGLFRAKTVGGNIKARDAALKAADDQARRDGIPLEKMVSKVSGYAAASGTRQEVEAELFSQYHWSPNPPPFVKVWGETLHKELGVDPTPFRKVVGHG